jgi:hypothetical protein
LATLRSRLLSFWGIPSGNLGIKGDVNHRRGYHRSFDWIKNSAYCTNRTYSVSETPGNRSPGSGSWLAALDISLDPARLYPMNRRLDQAVRLGALEKVTEWYGTFDGKTVVGYNNVTNQPQSSDISHLFHTHLSFDRRRVGEDLTDLYLVLTGAPMTLTELHALLKSILTADTPAERQVRDMIQGGIHSPANGQGLLTKVMEAIAAIPAGPPGSGGGLTADQVRQIVREELDKTRLTQ